MIKHITLKSGGAFRIIVIGIVTNHDVFRRNEVLQISYLRKSLHGFFIFRTWTFQKTPPMHR